ncbi:hypothetical protein P5V15_002543 [Pogonomyrmex californicus]
MVDIHVEHFHHLLRNYFEYTPVETWRIQCLEIIQPTLINKKHIQILHSSSDPYDGHWIYSYYDTKNIFIYDSLNDYFQYNFEKNSAVKFPVVQRQPNNNDCGVFAIAFAVKYNHSLMRLHLLKILETNIIEHFPQDSHNAVIKVLPLAVIKDREARAAYMRSIRQSEKKYITKDKECLESKRAKKRRQFNENLENNRTKKRCLYNKNLIDNRAKKRCRYQNIEHNHIKDRQQYTNNRLKICEQKCMRYVINK